MPHRFIEYPVQRDRDGWVTDEGADTFRNVAELRDYVDRLLIQTRGGARASGPEMAEIVSQQMLDEGVRATNNSGTWRHRNYDGRNWGERTAIQRARQLDATENQQKANKGFHPNQSIAPWQYDCGLMAGLVNELHAGNCDDVASSALNRLLIGGGTFVAALVQEQAIGHSFVILKARGDRGITYLDTWVPERRVGQFDNAAFRGVSDPDAPAQFRFVVMDDDQGSLIDLWNGQADNALNVDADQGGPRESHFDPDDPHIYENRMPIWF